MRGPSAPPRISFPSGPITLRAESIPVRTVNYPLVNALREYSFTTLRGMSFANKCTLK